MDELQGTSGIEMRRVWRHPSQTTLLLQLSADDCERVVRVHRSLNPMLFDFITEHAKMPTDADSVPGRCHEVGVRENSDEHRSGSESVIRSR